MNRFRPSCARRAGYALLELIITLALVAVIAAALGSVLLTHLRLARIVEARVSAADAVRLALHVLHAELRFARPDTDIRTLAANSVTVRLPRAAGVICARSESVLWARLSGIREPDPAKDSLLLVSGAGELALPVSAVARDQAACAPVPGFTVYRFGAPPLPRAGAVLVFESGNYYLRDRALRFRIGAEGRQPLTEEVLVDRGSAMQLHSDSATASIEVRVLPGSAFGRVLARPARTSFTLLNAGRTP